MNDEFNKLTQAAKQLLDTEVLMGANFLPRCRCALAISQEAQESAGAGGETTPAPSRGVQLPPLESMPQTRQAKAAALAELGELAQQCLKCTLGQTRTNLVFGDGDPAAGLVFVGEAPGEEEDKTGHPFVGRAGQKLTEMIQAMGLTREQVYICNVLKCRPPNNRPPTPQEVVECWPFLLRQLQIIHPKVIVTLGNPATHALLDTTIGITKLRGQWQALPDWAPGLGGIDVMPTFHPSYVIRYYTPEVRGMVWSDLKKVMQKLGLKVGG